MRLSLRMFVMVVLAVGLAVGTSLAQDPNGGRAVGWSPAAPDVVAVDKEQAAATIADRWSTEVAGRGYNVADWRSELTETILRASDEQIRLALKAPSYGEAIVALTGKNPDTIVNRGGAAADLVPQAALGDNSDDLSFTAINPCRILDTRFGTGAFAGVRAGGSTTTISTRVTASIAAQGGNAAGCPMPGVDAGGVAFTITLIEYSDPGFVTVFPATATRPLASTLNFGPGTAPSAVANTSVVQQCYSCGDNTDISIYVEGGSTQVIIDVVGYYDPTPQTTCTSSATVSFDLTGACQNWRSCTLTNPSTRARRVICSAVAIGELNHTSGTDDTVWVNVATDATTCGGWWTAGTAVLDVAPAMNTGCCWQNSTATQNTFTLAAGTTQTYYLNVSQTTGNDAIDKMLSAQLRCTLLN